MTDFERLLRFSPVIDPGPRLVLVKRADDRDTPFTIAVDLDGTLAEKQEPFDSETIGPPRDRTIAWVRKFKAAGARIIVFTVRGNVPQVEAWLEANDVPFDYVNENPDQPEGASGKILADVYFDDRAFNAEDPDEHGPTILDAIPDQPVDEDELEEGCPRTIIIRTITISPARDILAGLDPEADADDSDALN